MLRDSVRGAELQGPDVHVDGVGLAEVLRELLHFLGPGGGHVHGLAVGADFPADFALGLSGLNGYCTVIFHVHFKSSE